MSDNTINNKNNNKVYQNTNLKMTERQSSTNTTSTNNISTSQSTSTHKLQTQTPQHQHFINIPIPPNSTPNINILQQLNLPPLPPPAAFQPIIQPQTPGAPTNTINTPKLNPSAPTFTPNPFINIPLQQNNASTPSVSVQGYQQQTQQQINFINQKIQESLAKLQLLSIQLNTLNLINQQQQTIQSLQQYQNVYQQYQLEIGNSLLLNQYLANLKQNMSPPATPGVITPGLNDDNSSKKPTIGQLETIEEGEEEEMMEDGDDIAAAAPTTPDGGDANEGTKGLEAAHPDTEDVEEQKYDTLDTETGAIGESLKNDVNHSQPVDLQIGEGNEKVSELEKIKRQIRGILNKITPENFDKLSQEIASILKIADIAVQNKQLQSLTDEQLRVAQKAQFKALIRLILKCILEKAVNEPLFSNQYARLCYSLYLYAEQNELKKKLFRQQLLSLAHSVFKKARNTANSARFIGIVTMIGELFIYSLISWNVISSGIFEELLPPESALDIEAVCKLLKVSGHHFDKHHYKDINSVIDRIAKYAQGYDFRTQCLVKDIYEMRQNDWKQREVHQKEQPKTLTQVHKDFHSEKKMKHRKVNNNNNTPQPPQKQQQQQQQSTYRPANNYNNNGYQPYKPRHNSSARNYHTNRGGNRWRNNNNNHNNNHHGYHYNNRYHGNHHHHNNQYHHGHSTHYNQRRKSKNLRPTVEFVKDVTLPDRSHYPANQVLVKTWAMRNSGELSWGDNVELVYFKGDESLSVQKRYKVINAQPGSEVEISATIKTPSEPGRYCTYFRLQKNGKFFGPRVWVDIIVSDQSTNARLTAQEVHNKQMVSCQ